MTLQRLARLSAAGGQFVSSRPLGRPGRQLPLCLLGGILFFVGCRATPGVWTNDRPLSHSVKTAGFIIRSDFAIAEDAPMIGELEQLQTDVVQTLQLPVARDPVVVYLFSTESGYRRYMRTTWPNLPNRRAYFIGTSRELAVYSFHGPRMQEDLRHELTHGILHATLKTVPLWLDEGLAEYFEVSGTETGAPHPEHVRSLRRSMQKDWAPSIARLEDIVDFQEFDREDYAESWGWVHYMLHGDTQHKQVLVDYLSELRDAETANSILSYLPPDQRSATYQLTGWINSLPNPERPSAFQL
jgi:hypothetical protein